MTKKPERRVWPGFMSVVVPSAWTYSEEGGVISVFDARTGVGVLQVSFARRSSDSEPTQEEAIDLAESFCRQRRWPISRGEIRPARIAESPAAEVTFSEGEGAFWHLWQVVDIEGAMTVTYTCDEVDSSVEEQERKAIVNSLRWERIA